MKKQITLLITMLLASCLPSFGQVDNMATPPESAPVVIYGEISSPQKYESLEIQLLTEATGLNSGIHNPVKENLPVTRGTLVQGTANSQVFRFTSEQLSQPSYLTIKNDKDIILYNIIVTPGDSVLLRVDDYNRRIFFAGSSGESFDIQYELYINDKGKHFGSPRSIQVSDVNLFLDNDNNRELFEESNRQYGIQMSVVEYDFNRNLDNVRLKLEKIENELTLLQEMLGTTGLSEIQKDLIIANKTGDWMQNLLFDFYLLMQKVEVAEDLNYWSKLTEFYAQKLLSPKIPVFDDYTMYYSSTYHSYLISKFKVSSKLIGGDVISNLIDNHKGILLEKLLTFYVLKNFKYLEESEISLESFMQYLNDPSLIDKVQKMYNAKDLVKIESYVLEDQSGEYFDWDSVKGKIVLLDFWYTGCRACIQFKDKILSELEDKFKDEDDFVIISISTDNERGKWKKSLINGKYTVERSVNLFTNGRDHAFLKALNVFSYPHHIILDRETRILKSRDFPDNSLEFAEIIEDYLSKTRGLNQNVN